MFHQNNKKNAKSRELEDKATRQQNKYREVDDREALVGWFSNKPFLVKVSLIFIGTAFITSFLKLYWFTFILMGLVVALLWRINLISTSSSEVE